MQIKTKQGFTEEQRERSSKLRRVGFTLIELLVAIGIIIILASLVIVNVLQARMNGRDAKRISDLKSIQTALEMNFEKNKSYPAAAAGYSSAVETEWTALGADTTGLGQYINPLPKDPMNEKPSIKIVDGGTLATEDCDSRSALGAGVVMAYQYKTDAAGDSYKIIAPLEVRCEGLDVNDGGILSTRYELWGGKNGSSL